MDGDQKACSEQESLLPRQEPTIQRNENSCKHQATSLGENSGTWQASCLAQLPITSFAHLSHTKVLL